MREVVLDTETTGLDPDNGDRIVEIGCVELVNHLATGRTYQTYLDPERDMPIEAFRVHGLSREFLTGKPVFAAVAPELLEFIGRDPLVIHNAAFDLKFMNAELTRAGHAPIPAARAIDTLEIARRRFPGAQISLDALCRRFDVNLSERTLHGALLDAQLLAAVYLELIGGREPGLSFREQASQTTIVQGYAAKPRPAPLPPRLTEAERDAHTAFLNALPAPALWFTT